MLTPVAAGRVMLTIAALGLVVSVVGTAVGWRLAGDLDQGVGQSLELTADVLTTVDESFALADDSLEILGEGVGEAERAVRALSASMREGAGALEGATDLTGGEVADALESVENSLPDVESAAEAIDDTLAALNALPFGVSYGPDRPLGETIGELREELRELPDDLREQAAQVEQMQEELTEATEGTAATARSLAELEEQLEAASELIDDYASSTGEAQGLIEEQREVLAASATRTRMMVLAFGVVFALSQFVPLYLGWSLLGRGRVVGPEV
jgi:DNA repair ATPase RecN